MIDIFVGYRQVVRKIHNTSVMKSGLIKNVAFTFYIIMLYIRPFAIKIAPFSTLVLLLKHAWRVGLQRTHSTCWVIHTQNVRATHKSEQ